MSDKTVAGIVLILAVINLFAWMWFVVLIYPHFLSAFMHTAVICIVIMFSTFALSEKK